MSWIITHSKILESSNIFIVNSYSENVCILPNWYATCMQWRHKSTVNGQLRDPRHRADACTGTLLCSALMNIRCVCVYASRCLSALSSHERVCQRVRTCGSIIKLILSEWVRWERQRRGGGRTLTSYSRKKVHMHSS